MLRGKRLLVAGAGAVLAVALVAGAAFAQSTPTPSPGQSGQAKTSYGQYFLDQLASALNISRDQLNAAAKTAADNTIDKQQQDGKITADQATAAKQRVDQGNGFGNWLGFGRGGVGGSAPGGRGFAFGGGAYFDGVAKALGMTTADLQTQLKGWQDHRRSGDREGRLGRHGQGRRHHRRERPTRPASQGWQADR